MPGTKAGGAKRAAKRHGIPYEEYIHRVESGEKFCWICRTWKLLFDFHKDASREDGHESKCRTCRAPKVRKPPFIPSSKGRKHTPEARAKMSQSQKGNQNRKGKPWQEKDLVNLRRVVREHALKGEQHPRWKGGAGSIADKVRGSIEYKEWRKAVYRRDGFTCQECGSSKGGTLTAHHIKPFADFPELRFDVSNGITLCWKCHEAKHPGRKMRNLFKRKSSQA